MERETISRRTRTYCRKQALPKHQFIDAISRRSQSDQPATKRVIAIREKHRRFFVYVLVFNDDIVKGNRIEDDEPFVLHKGKGKLGGLR